MTKYFNLIDKYLSWHNLVILGISTSIYLVLAYFIVRLRPNYLFISHFTFAMIPFVIASFFIIKAPKWFSTRTVIITICMLAILAIGECARSSFTIYIDRQLLEIGRKISGDLELSGASLALGYFVGIFIYIILPIANKLFKKWGHDVN